MHRSHDFQRGADHRVYGSGPDGLPDELARAKEEFAERTGGGIGGSRWIAPLMPVGAPAPVHFRWPEYISTPRGEQEWWIPQDAR